MVWPPAAPGQVVDLMAALQESVAKAQAARGENPTGDYMPKMTAKKTAPARKAAAKKATGRKPRSA